MVVLPPSPLPRPQFLSGVVVDWLLEDIVARAPLLATVKVGWEAGVQYNAYVYYELASYELFAIEKC